MLTALTERTLTGRLPAGRTPLGVILTLLLGIGLAAAGCDFAPVDPGDGDGDGDGGNGAPDPVPRPAVTIRFANLTDLAVLADVYVTDSISTNGADLDPDVIFADDNQLTDGVGLASTGVLVPQSTDSVEVECTEGLVVATTGGVFRDPDTGDELGTGNQRILQEGLVFDCEAEITFVYRQEDGAYSVVVQLD